MPRRFTNATDLFKDLLDRHEAGTPSPIAYPDYDHFASVVDADIFIEKLRKAEDAGAVSITWGRGSKREQVAHVRLEASDVLYRILDRAPVRDIAADAYAQLVAGHAFCLRLADAALGVRAVWSRAKSWHGFAPAEVSRLRDAFALAQSIVDGQHIGTDYRTFSRRVTGDSKTLERCEGAVVRLLKDILDLPPGARPRDALRTLGLEKFASPLLIAGRVNLGATDLSGTEHRYLGIAPDDAHLIGFREQPAYLLTIENFASFNRHTAEADPQGLGTTIYVGGYPSLATQKALRTLADLVPTSVPIFHWSDIDIDGAWIFQTIDKAMGAAGRRLRPHLMSPDIAKRLGARSPSKPTRKACPADSGIFALMQYLTGIDPKVLEQEELDPCLPNYAER